MRLQSVVVAVSCLLSNAADCIAGPIGIFRLDRTSNSAVASSFHQVNDHFAALGVAMFGNEGRYLRWDDILMQGDGDITFHGHSPVVQLRVSTFSNSGYAPQLTFLLPPSPRTSADEWWFDHKRVLQAHDNERDGKRNKVLKGDPKCKGDCPTPVPEPASATLLAISVGLAGVAARCRRHGRTIRATQGRWRSLDS